MSIISEFLVLGGIYYHDFSIANDSNLCCDFDANPLVHYNRSAIVSDVRGLDKDMLKHVMDPVGTVLGRFRIEDDHWLYEGEDGKRIVGLSANDADGLLKSEVLVSKAYIAEWFPLEKSV